MVFQSRNRRRWGVLAATLLSLLASVAQAAPELRLEKPDHAPRVGEAFEVRAVVTWTGDSAAYAITTGALDPPTWGEGAWERVDAKADGDHNELAYVARFTAREAGELSVPELRLVYTDPTEKPLSPPPAVVPQGEATPVAPAAPAEAPTHTLSAERFVLTVKADHRWLYPYVFLAIMLIGAGIAGGSVLLSRRKEAAAARQQEALAPFQTVEAALHNARRHRLDGDFYSFYRELHRLVQFVGGEVKGEFGTKLQNMVQRVGFQGYAPNDDEIEGTLKDIERALARWKEGKAA